MEIGRRNFKVKNQFNPSNVADAEIKYSFASSQLSLTAFTLVHAKSDPVWRKLTTTHSSTPTSVGNNSVKTILPRGF